MDYAPDEYTALVSEIEKQGGALLPEKCEGTFAVYSVPNGTRTTKVKTCHCNNKAMMVSTYDLADEGKFKATEMRGRGAGFVRACAVCDSMGAWPRYESVLADE